MAAPTAWIELKNVSKRYGRQAVLDGANATVERGQFVAVMGGVGVVTGNAGPGNTATSFSPKLLVFALDASGASSTSGQP